MSHQWAWPVWEVNRNFSAWKSCPCLHILKIKTCGRSWLSTFGVRLGIQQDSDRKRRAEGCEQDSMWNGQSTGSGDSLYRFKSQLCLLPGMLSREIIREEKDWSNMDRAQLTSYLPALVPRKEEPGTNELQRIGVRKCALAGTKLLFGQT